MTRPQLLQHIQLKEELINIGRPNRTGTVISPTYITIHNTANTSPGADANAHARFVCQVGYYNLTNATGAVSKNWVSWHYTVDDRVAIRHLPLHEKALHAGTNANNSSIAIQVCMQAGINQDAANFKAAQLTALLCYDLAIPLASVVPHKYWSGKNCPTLLLKAWEGFITQVAHYIDELNAEDQHIDPNKAIDDAFENDLSQFSFCWQNRDEPQIDVPAIPNANDNVQEGFNVQFLDVAQVHLPVLQASHANFHHQIFLHHQNLSIYFNTQRKLALYTACNYYKDKLIVKDVKRSNAFKNDNIDNDLQLGDGFYKSETIDASKNSNYFDRGHIIARRYNQWGNDKVEAQKGEKDTYFFTTIAPQTGELNQDEWEKMESFIIEQGKLDVRKVSVIAGCILSPTDPIATYNDFYYKTNKIIALPVVFWKIVYYLVDGRLRKIAFLMSQKNKLKELSFVDFGMQIAATTDPFEKIDNPLKTYIVKSSLIEQHTGLKFTKAKELYTKKEPLEVVIIDNDTHIGASSQDGSNILAFI